MPNIIYNEDCLEVLKRLGDNSIDAIVTDPPYNLGFMGKKWDRTGIAFNLDLWKECLRVIKPGGNLLAFGGTRTYHRMVCAIEDAGFEIRDCIMWVYGSGFPKSLDISKAIDKRRGAKREVIGRYETDMGGLGGERLGKNGGDITIPATPEAKLWEGYGTGLKPAYEPIVLAMKPLDGTFAENCLKWGVGGLNIDGCRIGNEEILSRGSKIGVGFFSRGEVNKSHQGRFPANFIHDGSQEVMELFPETLGKWGKHVNGKKYMGRGIRQDDYEPFRDSGSAARFFYCAKASRSERDAGLEDMPRRPRRANNKNIHPTVKPLALMEYLVKLATRPGHIVLDPFIGSGTTAIACVKLGRHYIGCELDKGYYDICIKRIEEHKTRQK